MRDLSIVVPSRGRPDSIRELVQTFIDTCRADTQLVVCVDRDDPTLQGYLDAVQEFNNFTLYVGEPSRIGPILNRNVPQLAKHAFAVGFMGDDHRPRTVGWDLEYVNQLRAMGTGIVYGDDLFQRENIPTQVAMTSDIVLATGKFIPDGMLHLYLDDMWKTLGQALGAIRYLPNVVVEHMHPAAGKAQWDEGYVANNSQATYDADRVAFEAWRQNDLATWVEQIRRYGAETA